MHSDDVRFGDEDHPPVNVKLVMRTDDLRFAERDCFAVPSPAALKLTKERARAPHVMRDRKERFNEFRPLPERNAYDIDGGFMNIFESIVSKIFHPQNAQTQPQAPQQPAQAAAPTQSPVDVKSILAGLAAKNSQKLNWQTSIVDLLKLLGLDSSLQARTQLAKELGYTGDTADSAKMNIWLSSEVMSKLAMNGGQVPPELKH